MDIFFQEPPLGEVVITEIPLPEDITVVSTEIELTGEPFVGDLNQESFGTTVSAVGGGGSSNEFVVDFHTFRTIVGVSTVVDNRSVTAVYMWLGTNFLTKSSDDGMKPNLLLNSPSTLSGTTYFEEVTTTKLRVQLNGTLSLQTFRDDFQVTGRSFPLNLRAKLGDEDPFWASPGEFSGRAMLPAFDEALNRLKSQGGNGENKIPLVLLSDAPGNVTVQSKKIGFRVEKVHVNGDEIAKFTLEADRDVPINISSLPIGEPGDRIYLKQFGFDLQGVILSNLGVKVSPTFSAAIKVEPTIDLQVRGFKILLGKDVSSDLELFAEIQTDQDGRPLAEEVLASSPIQVDHKIIDRDFWLEVNFEESVELKTERAYWIVLKSKNGTAEWKAHLQKSPAQIGEFKFTKNAGQTWQDHKVTGFVMLISDPPVRDTRKLLELQVEMPSTDVSRTYHAQETAAPVEFVLEEAITISLDDEGRINCTLLFGSAQNGFIELSRAFMNYYIKSE
ncbi:MAG: hypothetical protein ACFFCW_00095 [Candidatus Hodarchaeota archaeon]